MSSKDPIEELLDQDRLMEPALRSDAKAFEAGVHQKITMRQQRRRSMQVVALFCCIIGVGTLNNLDIEPKESEAMPAVADAGPVSQPDSEGAIEAAVFDSRNGEWDDDPFESWEEEMPADYDLVAGL